MPSEHFTEEYMRVARLADADLVDGMEWEKTHGANLERIVADAKRIVSDLGALQLMEKETAGRDRRLDLSSVGMSQTPVAAFHFRSAAGEVRIWIEKIQNSPFSISAAGKPVVIESDKATSEWVEAAIAELFVSLNRP